PTSIHYYRRAGFLPEAMLNFMGLFGWTRGEGDEKFTLEEFIEHFELEKLSLGGPVFDVEKLRWLNGRYIRERYDAPALLSELRKWALSDEHLLRIVPLAQPRMETLSDWGYLTAFFFADRVPLDPERLQLKGKSAEDLAGILQMAVWLFEELPEFTSDGIEQRFRDLSERLDVKLRDLTKPFYVAITGAETSTPLFRSMEILGLDIARVRLRQAIEALGGISSRRAKAIERDFRRLFQHAPED
ncbi:MAG: glutamate--tRNA ligase family protein, partial [Vicinamibacteria bacterium]